MSNDPEWTPARRAILRSALRKAQAGAEQREPIYINGAESAALYKAAEAWADMMDMLDAAHANGELKGLKNEK